MCREVEKLVMAERAKSRAEGFAEGYAEGFAEGRAEVYIESSARAVRNVMAKMSLSVEEAMQFLDLPDSEKDAVRKLVEW